MSCFLQDFSTFLLIGISFKRGKFTNLFTNINIKLWVHPLQFDSNDVNLGIYLGYHQTPGHVD